MKIEPLFISRAGETSAMASDECLIYGGRFDGVTLADAIKTMRADGCEPISAYRVFDSFPLSFKLRDKPSPLAQQTAGDRLFYIFKADKGAGFIKNLKSGTSGEQLSAAADEGRLSTLFNILPVREKDFVSVIPDDIFAFGPCVEAIEIAQTSALDMPFDPKTFNPASRVKNAPLLKKPPIRSEKGFSLQILYAGAAFTAAKIEIAGEYESSVSPASFHLLRCLDGDGYLSFGTEKYTLPHDCTLLLPASFGTYHLGGGIEVLLVTL